jgi:hypothetical protein
MDQEYDQDYQDYEEFENMGEEVDDVHRSYTTASDWRDDSRCPTEMERCLALRNLVLEYEDFGLSETRTQAHGIQPEAKYSIPGNVFMVPRFFPPYNGYPVASAVSQDDGGRVTSGSSPDVTYQIAAFRETNTLDGMISCVAYLTKCNRAWCFDKYVVENVSPKSQLGRVARCYRRVPIHAFDYLAVRELMRVGTDSEPWGQMYSGISDATVHSGIYGILHDNSAIDMRPYEEGTTDDRLYDPSLRKTEEGWMGFIDCTYTPASTEAGKIRSLVHRVRYRLMTREVMKKASALLDIISMEGCHRPPDEGNTITAGRWIFHFNSLVIDISERTARNVIRVWLDQLGHDTPSLHVFPAKKVLSMSVTSGCLVRPIFVEDTTGYDDSQLKWVDSLIFGSQEMMSEYGYKVPSRKNPLEYTRTFMHLVPYAFFDQPPRPLLAGSMSTQAICRPRLTLFSTIVPEHSVDPIVRTPLMDVLCKSLDTTPHLNVPGFPLLTLYANMKDNYEDSIIVSSEVNRLKVFSHRSIVYHPVPYQVPFPRTGAMLNNQVSWWRPYDEGRVIAHGVSKTKMRYVVCEMKCDDLRVGDKVATQHGQKFTISSIRDPEDMPLCVDTNTEREFRPHVVMASSSVHNRVTPGQIYESWAAMEAVGSYTFDPKEQQNPYITGRLGLDKSVLPQRVCTFRIGDDENPVYSARSVNPLEPVRADYGVAHFWLLGHLAREKQHFLSSVPRSVGIPKGRLKGSSVRFGEMEIMAMLANGLPRTLSELLDSYDMSIVDICSKCLRLSLLCDCPTNDVPTTQVCVRQAAVKVDICRAIYTFHSSNSSDIEDSQQPSGEALSFKYIVQ